MFKMREKMITVGLLGTAALIPIDFAKADQLGRASWYSLPQNSTANGERMNPDDLTAAHRSLPFGTRVLVENLSNGQSVVVRINDRGPFTGGRIIDLSRAAAASIGMIDAGVAKVRVSTAGGGALAALGGSKAKARIGASVPAAEADAAKPKAGANKMAGTAPKPSKAKPSTAKSAAAKSAKTRIATSPVSKKAATAPSRKRAGSQETVKVTAAAKRSKASGRAAAPVRLAASTNRIRAAAQQPSSLPSGRVTVASNTRHPRAAHGKAPWFIRTTRTRKNRRAG